MTKSEYRKKLLDPRWQKKRLEILNRDGFKCKYCGDSESTLHVHHKRYFAGDPWDINNSCLVALCADCHEGETLFLKEAMNDLNSIIRERFCTEEVGAICSMFLEFSPDNWGGHYLGVSPRQWSQALNSKGENK